MLPKKLAASTRLLSLLQVASSRAVLLLVLIVYTISSTANAISSADQPR
jgi:hypothetical protein